MEKYGTAFGKYQFVVIILGGLFSLAALIILILGTTEKIVFTQPVLITMLTFFGLALLTVIYYYASFFKRNNALFIKGSLSAGITNLVMILLILFFILFVLFMSLPEYKDIFISIFTFATTISTDLDLLNKLKKERIRLAKEQRVKAYMIFNNQQSVALTTYKPTDELSFISIYGLGKKKFELYGEQFISIIVKHNSVAN